MQKYSVADIQSMRSSIKSLLLPLSDTYNSEELSANVERQLQTHILAGTTPEELMAAVREKHNASR